MRTRTPPRRAATWNRRHGFAGAGAGIGVISSGFLLTQFSWHSVFLVNLPIVAIALLAGARILPTSRDESHTPLDPVGAVLSVIGMGSLLYAGALTISLAFFANFGLFFVMTQFLPFVLGYSPLQAGFATLPRSLMIVASSPQAPAGAADVVREVFTTAGVVTFAAAVVLVNAGLVLVFVPRQSSFGAMGDEDGTMADAAQEERATAAAAAAPAGGGTGEAPADQPA